MNEIAIYTQAQQLAVKEYQGQRVITFRDVDTLHQRPEGTARKRFNDNRRRFIESEDFFKITASEFRTAFGGMDTRQQMDVILLTKMGYLMLVKSLTDDLAWMVQRQLVKSYFEAHETPRAYEPRPAPRAITGKPLPRMRTIRKAAAELAEKDPNTCMTATRLYRLAKQGKIKSYNDGKCKSVDLNEIERMIEGQ